MTVMIILSITISILLIIINYIISHKRVLGIVNEEGERRSQYECGLEPIEENLGIETRERFYLKFFIVGILFLIFDIETLFLYPILFLYDFSLVGSTLMLKSYGIILLFLVILLIGLIYETRRLASFTG